MSILERAKVELEAINFGKEDSVAMLEILALFFHQWDSGGAVFAAAPVLHKLICGHPLSPLTGADNEWIDRSEASGEPMWQNARLSTVFKKADGVAYDIDAPDIRKPIVFPYTPVRVEVGDPVVEF